MRASTTAVLALAATAAADMTCYEGAYILSARGTDQSRSNSSLIPLGEALVAAIPGSHYEEIAYPASFMFLTSAGTGIYNLTSQLTNYKAECPDSQTVLLGYSQGAAVVDVVLAGANLEDLKSTDLSGFIPKGANLSGIVIPPLAPSIGANIAAVVLFGDGTNVPGQGSQPDCNRCTANGTLNIRVGPYLSNMQRYANRLQDWCSGSDPICCTTGDDPIAHLSYFGNSTIQAAVDFVKAKVEAAYNTASSAAPSSTSSAQTCSVTVFPGSSAGAYTTVTSSTATGTSGATAPLTVTPKSTSSKAGSTGTTTTPAPAAGTGAAYRVNAGGYVVGGAAVMGAMLAL